MALFGGCNTANIKVPGFTGLTTINDFKTEKYNTNADKDNKRYLSRVGYSFAELPKLEQYLNSQLVMIIRKNGLEQNFAEGIPKIKVSVNSAFNAETLENGLIVFNTGMLMQLQYVEELDAVIAHELVHILDKHHTRNSLFEVSDKLLQAYLLKSETVFAKSSKDELMKNFTSWAKDKFIEDSINSLMFTKWNRDQEDEADKLGLALMYGAELNLEGMLSFMKKRISFERKHPSAFNSQNQSKFEILEELKNSLVTTTQNATENTSKEKVENSLTNNYLPAKNRYLNLKQVINQQYSDYKKGPFNVLDLPNSRELNRIYALRKVHMLIDKKHYRSANKIALAAIKGDLRGSAYSWTILSLLREAQGRHKDVTYNTNKLLALKNISANEYATIIGYYEKNNDKKTVLATLGRMNKELDYPNSYLHETIRLQKKFGADTYQTEVQCYRTANIDILRGCQLALGRPLKVKTNDLVKAVNESL